MGALGTLVVCATAAAQHSGTHGPYTLSIPAEPLGDALNEFARQAGLQVLFPSQLVARHTSPEVKGSLTAEEGLQRLLSDTNLRYEFVNPHTITILGSPRPAERPAAPEPRTEPPPNTDNSFTNPRKSSDQSEESTMPHRSIFSRLAGLFAVCGSALHVGGACAESASANVNKSAPLEEIVVTATKQMVAINKVPISVAAETQAQLDQQGVKSFGDLAAITPGVIFQPQFNSGAPTFNLSVRGIESRTSQPTTAVYLDDTALATRSENNNLGIGGVLPQAFDLDRTEVLRGPQGTLFGASSEGGAIRFITAAPSLTTYTGYGRAELAFTKNGDPSYQGGAAVGGPIIDDKLGFRASASYTKDGGFVNQVIPVVGQAGNAGMRYKDSNWGRTETVRLALLAQPIDWLKIEPSIYHQRAYGNDQSAYEVAISNPDSGDFNHASNSRSPSDDRFTVAALRITADLGAVDLTSISSQFRRDITWSNDYVGYQDYSFFGQPYGLVPGETAIGAYDVAQTTYSEELRLASRDRAAKASWQAGLYYEHADQDDSAYVAHDALPGLIQQIYGASIEQVLGAPLYLGKYVYFDDVTTTVKQAALFADVNFKLADTLTLELGGRYSNIVTDTGNHLEGPFAGGRSILAGSTTDHPFTPKVALSWQKDESSLYYASVSKGFRPGGVNTLTNNPQAQCQAFQQANNIRVPSAFTPDSLWSYEVGAKNQWLDEKLQTQASAYHINWRDIQLAGTLAPCGFGAVFNLGSATSNGFDLSVSARPTPNVKLGLGVGYTHGSIDKSIKGFIQQGDEIGTSPVDAVPPWTVTANAEYDFDLFNFPANVWLQDSYHSSNAGHLSALNPLNPIFYDAALRAQPSTKLLNVRTGLQFDHASVSLFVNNLLNAHPTLSYGHTAPGDGRYYGFTIRPMTVGLTATLKF